MKYESEIIHEILEQRGHEFPDLHYQSECVESWIEEAKGAYPKLCDYESEWLNYINENPIGDFPYETVTTNSTATVNHVVPFEYKSAILKGNTLVNITSRLYNTVYSIQPYSGMVATKDNLYDMNKRFYVMFDVVEKPDKLYMKIEGGDGNTYKCSLTNSKEINEIGKVWFITDINSISHTHLKITSTSNSSASVKIKNIVVVEYQEGMENWDIPYFTGMQSVKMPVLKTTGKNLINILEKGYISNIGNNMDDNLEMYTRTDFIKLKKDKQYIFSNNGNKRSFHLFVYDLNKNFIEKIGIANTYTPQSDCFIRLFQMDNISNALYQVEENSVATSYEPYKSNILSTSEDVTLRGIGDVKDELNCLTGEVIERIGEIVLDGSEEWYINKETEKHISYYSMINSNMKTMFKALTNSLPCYYWGDVEDLSKECFWSFTSSYGMIVSKTECPTIEEFKQKLSRNPVLLQYELNKSAIKTVDLTVVNQNGETLSKIKPIEGTMHINVSGATIAPTAVLEVPVEAITQNLASFIETEE